MKNSNKIYKKLKKKYSDAEIAESFIFDIKLSPKQKAKSDLKLKEIIAKQKANKK